jgi:hypothetical protein
MEEQQPMGVGAYYSDQQDSAQIMKEADPAKIMVRIAHSLKAEEHDPFTKKWVRKEGVEPYLNDRGISAILAELESLLNYNTTLSNLDDKEVSRIIMGYGLANLRKSLYLNHKEWGLRLENATAVLFIVLYPVYLALKRGYMKGDKEFLKGTIQSIVHQQDTTIHDSTRKSGGLRRRLGL